MTWEPELNVVDLTPVVDNLLGYIEDNQTDALEWASAGGLAPLTTYKNAAGRLSTIYPQLIVLTQTDSGEVGTDSLASTEFVLRIETAVMGTADELPTVTKQYDLAIRSMLVNVPSEMLCAGMKTTTRVMEREIPATVYDVLRGTKRANSYLQIFQTEMTYIFQTNLV
jgi:hypothetical protein